MNRSAAAARRRRRAPGPVTLLGLFMTLVAAMLAAVPGWGLCYGVWVAFSWLVLGVVVLGAAALLVVLLVRREWPQSIDIGRQAVAVLLCMGLLPLMGPLSTWVELAWTHGDLAARAQASARSGGPRLAMQSEDGGLEPGGIFYDPDGEIAKPVAARSAAWRDSRDGKFLDDECVGIRHLVGAYYRWQGACDVH
jgi:hypothetical protein